MKVKEIEYSDFLELANFVKSHFEGDEDVNSKTLLVMRKFLPELEGLELITLMNFLNDINEETYKNFIKVSGESLFDPSGKSEPKEAEMNDVNLTLINAMADKGVKEDSKEKIKRRHREVVAAKNLKPLKLLKNVSPYKQVKRKALLSLKNIVNEEILSDLEKFLDKLEISDEVLSYVLIYMMNRSEDNARVFFEHFYIRLKSCAKDDSLINEDNKEFYNRLEDLLKK